MDSLIERAKSGDESALIELVGNHEVRVRLYAAKVSPRPDMAEDIAQKAFIVALKKLGTFDSSANFGFWLQGIVRNVARQEWERLTSRSKVERDGLAEYLDQLASSPMDAATDDMANTRLDALRGCLERLQGRAKEIVKLCYGMDMSCKDVSSQIGVSVDAVKMALVRIRGSLRTCIQAKLAENLHGQQ